MATNLTIHERVKIEALHSNGHKPKEIASYLGRHRSSIYRELGRHVDADGLYSCAKATVQAKLNMTRILPNTLSIDLVSLVEEKIVNDQWSPEQISGWLKSNNLGAVSHTWIYSHIEKDKGNGGELSNHLRHGTYSKGPVEYRGKIKDRVTIEKRPEIVNQRARLGDYEIDLIVGPKNRGAILTAIDRKSRYCLLHKLSGKTAEEVKVSVIEILKPYSLHTITSDNGTEFTEHKDIASQLNIDYYFANPYASYERGSIENLNGLVRQYIPKGTDFSDIKIADIERIENKLNNRPRKILDFLTPIEYIKKHDFSEAKI